MNDEFEGAMIGGAMILSVAAFFGLMTFAFIHEYNGVRDLQTILKDQCGMEYTAGEVWRNGENLSRICGLKND